MPPAQNPSFVTIGWQKTVIWSNTQYYCSNLQPSPRPHLNTERHPAKGNRTSYTKLGQLGRPHSAKGNQMSYPKLNWTSSQPHFAKGNQSSYPKLGRASSQPLPSKGNQTSYPKLGRASSDWTSYPKLGLAPRKPYFDTTKYNGNTMLAPLKATIWIQPIS